MNSLRRLATDLAINGSSSGCGLRPGGSEYTSEYARSSDTVSGSTDDTSVCTVHSKSLADALTQWDVRQTRSETVRSFYRAAPGGVPTTVPFSQERRYDDVDIDRKAGVIREVDHAFSKDGGLAVLSGQGPLRDAPGASRHHLEEVTTAFIDAALA